ncbi:MAG: hypothetical protein K9J37_12160 [Saprospiraceae bacterium]|nr:hypothetical protein [Saprospiraceae bacterium]MCF8250663.1 hypothetical protein [Saprospiraceae bacterium]MCF8280801.1 hypothetical protein [Bacteroidales bacterium]MCF8312515.1 hypothetical protein [Saprospiraceae bacterium]MCF8440805.1 hypothetical protein [Saprospiraceae bacterium]
MSLRLSFSDLVNEAVNLEFQDYEKFVKQVSLLRSKKQVAGKQTKESALLEKINNGFPVEKWTKMQVLDDKMESSGIDEKEMEALTALTEEYEHFTVQRLRWIKKLALLRNVSIDKIIAELGMTNGKA